VDVMLKDIPGVTLTWLGTIGAAITLFAGLLTPLDMADWAWWLVQSWQEATPSLWDRLAAGVGAEIPAALIPSLTMSVFLIMIGLGVGLRQQRSRAQSVVSYPALQLGAAMTALLVIGYALLASSPSASLGTGVPSDAPLAVFLAGATVSFSPPIAGSGNLTTRLWLVLVATALLLALNELTKIVQ
jgi:hypothetical protein